MNLELDYEMNKYILNNIGLLLVVFSAVHLNLWCAVCVFSGVFLSLTPLWPTQAEKHLSKRTKALFSILCCTIQQERLNILSINLHLRVFIKPVFSFHFSLCTMQLPWCMSFVVAISMKLWI